MNFCYVVSNMQPFHERFQVKSELKRGGFGIVYAGVKVDDNLPVAIKQISKSRICNWKETANGKIPLEIILLSELFGTAGVIQMLNWYEFPKHFIIVMERPKNVLDLLDFISKNVFLNEQVASFIFYQIAKTVEACHQLGITHRDIKEENILVNTETLEVKLIDFGSGCHLEDNDNTYFEGTWQYCPPEWILFEVYDCETATIWSLGILLFTMVCGHLPFKSNEEIVEAKVNFLEELTPNCQDLILKCLSICPDERPALKQILNHPWLISNNTCS